MLNYREANLNDMSQLLELEQCVINAERPYNLSIKPEKTTYYNMGQLLSSNDAHVLVAEVSKTIVGTGYVEIRESKVSLKHDYHSYLGFIYVAPEYRGKNISQNIINKLILWSKGKGVNDFYLDVYSQNIAAVKAYEKVGFEPCLMEMQLSIK